DVGLRVEDLRGQLDRAVGLAVRGLDLNDADARARKRLFGSHSVAPPFAALLRNTRPPLGPGTAPLIRIRPESASTRCTVRFCVVTRTCPIRPAMRRPLNTRPGVAQPPIEPGLRCLRWVPWLAPSPLNPCRFMTPAVPLPLLV